ncbi:extracellular solute-binding protein [Paenibacillus sp. LMG 31460]|uniref:Extracellular solute-binding protein n=1 Tax=Paenibacillus germinis TaxID=2654979 RepID=A0ABX1Z4I7_9BACL|nr:ABC transporter substrate-binding protein [Paenibacillus germinis]NOU88290.1 extracellular solute-binding protein [Paenibacillus germinis]
MKGLKRKLVGIGLTTILAVTMLAGCGGNNNKNEGAAPSGAPALANEEVTLKILFPGDPPKDLDAVSTAVDTKMKADGLNFKLNFTFVPWDTYWNKQSLIVAGGEDFDLTWSHIANLPQSVAKNVLLPLDEYLDSDGQQLKENTPDYVWKGAKIGGKIYAIPRVVPVAQNNDTFQIRGDLRKKYNLPEIKTLEDFDKYLEAVKANEPTMIPLGINTTGLGREYLPSYYANGDLFNSFFYIDVTQQPLTFKNLYESEAFANLVNKAHEWYNKGYTPKDPIAAKEDFGNGKTAAIASNLFRPTETIDGLVASVPGAEIEFVQFQSDKPKYIFNSVDNLLAVFSTSKHPKEAVRFVNWVHSNKENYNLFSLGVEGINYKLDGNSASYDGIANDKQYLPISWAWTDMRYAKFSKNITPAQLDVIKNWDNGAIKTNLIGFSVDSEPMKNEIAKVTAIVKEYQVPLYSGLVEYSSVKEKLLKRLKDAGINKVLNEYQKQLDAYLSAQK